MEIIQQLQSTTGLAYICSNQIQEKCWVCKKIFDRLSSDWVYKTRVGTSSKYLCSYRCWRAADKKKTPRLRGEKVAQDRINSGKERETP